jgi:predicted ATPase
MKQFESFRLDTSNQCLWRNSTQISIPPKPFAVLRYLVENPGRLISHDELLDALWPETYVQPQVLRTYVLDLRKILGDDAGQPRFIQTLPKRGYCFVAPVVEHASLERGKEAATTAQNAKGTAIVGREEELERLKAQLDLLASGQRRVVFVAGEAGIGKTALVDAFCLQVKASVAGRVARGQCVQGVGGKEDYYPVMEALGQLCASQDGESACRILARMAPAWLAQGRERERESSSDPRPVIQGRMVGDLCGALEELSAEKPLILIFEDIEWADESTLNLISALARRRAPARLMVLATYRPVKRSTEHPLKGLTQDLVMRRLCEEVTLVPLKKTAVSELLTREFAQGMLPPGLADFVHQRAEGNPLFAIAILKHLISERVLVRQGMNGTAKWEQRVPFEEMEASVPGELAQMIELEIERLSPEEQRLLEAGSLMNVAFPSWALAAALEKDASEIEEACDELARRLYFVERAGQDELPDGSRSAFYVFAHGIYREVIYQRQSATRRGKRHIRIAERLRELFAGREGDVAREMAMHFEAGGDWLGAASALRIAARRAQQRLAFTDAAELLERALHMTENLTGIERGGPAQEILTELRIAREARNTGTLLQEMIPEKV